MGWISISNNINEYGYKMDLRLKEMEQEQKQGQEYINEIIGRGRRRTYDSNSSEERTLISIGCYKIAEGKSKGRDILVMKMHGKKWYYMSYVKEWRKGIIERYLNLRINNNNDILLQQQQTCHTTATDWEKVAKIFVAFEAVNSARDYKEAINLLNAVKNMEYGEIHFWASKFLESKVKARSAFRILYYNNGSSSSSNSSSRSSKYRR